MTISHINYWDQVNFSKNLWKFWNGPLCRNESGPSPLINVAGYWKSSKTKACVKKLSQILANNIGNRGGGLVSELMWGTVGAENEQNVNIKRHFRPNELKEVSLVYQDWNTL